MSANNSPNSKKEKIREWHIYDTQGEGLKALPVDGADFHPINEVMRVIEASPVLAQIKLLEQQLKTSNDLLKCCWGFVDSYDNVGILRAELKDYLAKLKEE